MTLFAEVISSLIRYLLGVVFGVLVARQIISADLLGRLQNEGAVQVTSWVLTFALPLVWIWLKNQKRIRTIFTALRLPAGTSPERLEEVVKTQGPAIETVVK